jgi:hypothetical protein
MGQLVGSEGQPGNWEEPDFFLRRLETVRFQEKGWQERYDGRLSRTDLWGRGGEIPLRYPTKHPEYRLPNTGFFIINITPHWGMGHQESDAPILSNCKDSQST